MVQNAPGTSWWSPEVDAHPFKGMPLSLSGPGPICSRCNGLVVVVVLLSMLWHCLSGWSSLMACFVPGGYWGCSGALLHQWGVWSLIHKWPQNSLESRFPWKPRNSDFILFLKQPRNLLENWFRGFLRNSESRTWKLILFPFIITWPLIFILSYLLVLSYS